ncbi:MAG: class I SAM-dependent methyltransferase [Acidimicrobiales bacterium]
MTSVESKLSTLYQHRFDDADLAFKAATWTILCEQYFARWIRATDTVLDLGAGSCEFINAIAARRRLAVDLNPDTKRAAAPDVEVHLTRSDDMTGIESDDIDVVFSSNFFEHLPDPDALMATLAETRRVLAPGGRLLVMMPNIRYVKERFWDYVDHRLPLTHDGLTEALELAGFRVDTVVPRFLPYTVRSKYRAAPAASLRLYLRVPLLWRVFGAQMFVVARPAT